jgi:hypothetical protein
MALRTDPYGNIYCPQCNGKLEEEQWSFGEFAVAMFVGDIATWILAAVFVGLGFVWTPAYLIAACIVAIGMYRYSKRRQRYACPICRREFGYEDVHGT